MSDMVVHATRAWFNRSATPLNSSERAEWLDPQAAIFTFAGLLKLTATFQLSRKILTDK